MHDAAAADGWREALRKGAASFDRLLWNGEYYSLWVDGPRRDECCMSDQLSAYVPMVLPPAWPVVPFGRNIPES